MTLKPLAAACALALSSLALAAPPATLPTSGVNVVYIGGASAQKGPLVSILTKTSSVFATPDDVVTVKGPFGSTGYFGVAAKAVDNAQGNLLVVYNSTNGSAAGLNQLLSNQAGVVGPATPTWEAEAKVLTLANCGAAITGVTKAWAADCSGTTNAANLEIDMALSDVFATEFGSSGSLNDGVGDLVDSNGDPLPYLGIADLANAGPVTTGLEGFGVIVNKALYNDLLVQNKKDGVIPSTCDLTPVTGTALFENIGPTSTAACMPSISSAQYGRLAAGGATVNSSILTGSVQNTYLARRDELSGTQAASNIVFLNNVCGGVGYGGAQTPARFTNVNPKLIISEETATGNVISKVAGIASPDYALGVVSTSNPDKFADATLKYAYVKIDGVSPVHKGLGAVDPTRRFNIITGNYKFATEMGAYVRSSASGIPAAVSAAVANKLGNSIGLANDSTAVPGVAYLDQPGNGPADGNNSRFKRDGNNCAPLH
jgi:hypothetical protein